MFSKPINNFVCKIDVFKQVNINITSYDGFSCLNSFQAFVAISLYTSMSHFALLSATLTAVLLQAQWF